MSAPHFPYGNASVRRPSAVQPHAENFTSRAGRPAPMDGGDAAPVRARSRRGPHPSRGAPGSESTLGSTCLDGQGPRPSVGDRTDDGQEHEWPCAKQTTANRTTARTRRSGPAAKAVLTIAQASGQTRGVALVLHGGRADSYDPVRGRHLSPARMLPFAQALKNQGGRHGLAVWTLRNRYRGWNGKAQSPVQDARWALDHIRRDHPGVPVYLAGPLDGRPDGTVRRRRSPG